MALETLLVACFLTFLVFWLGDLYLTKKTTGMVGSLVEMNPVLRIILRFRHKGVWLFKGIEISVFSYLLLRLSRLDEARTFSILLLAILYYVLIISAGINAYIKVIGSPTPIITLFLAISLIMLLFINMSYKEYQNRVVVANTLLDCSSKYSYLYSTCQKKEQPQATESEFDKYKLNITIPK